MGRIRRRTGNRNKLQILNRYKASRDMQIQTRTNKR